MIPAQVSGINRLIGAHVSIAGGIDKSIGRATALGATAIQTFASSPRTVSFSPLPEAVVQAYLKQKAASVIQAHIFHGVYLVNLAHENPGYVQVCADLLINYQKTAARIGVIGTVFHVGSHKGKGFEAVADQVARAVKQILDQSPPEVWLMLENTAGQNGAIGSSLAELKVIADRVEQLGGNTKRLGLGLDSQHAYGAGYDLKTQTGLEGWLHEIDNTWGIEAVKVLHINDSLVPLGSHRDRHANWDEGEMGLETLAMIVNQPRLQHLPMILEVPGRDKSGPRKSDVAAVFEAIEEQR